MFSVLLNAFSANLTLVAVLGFLTPIYLIVAKLVAIGL